MISRTSINLATAMAASLLAAPDVLADGSQSADYRLVSAVTANGGGSSSAVSAGYDLRPASAEGTVAGRSSSADYTALAGWVSQQVGYRPAFSAWQILHFGSATHPDAAPLEDPDGDGRTNLLEFAQLSIPIGPGSGAIPPDSVTVTPAADGRITVAFRLVAAPDDLILGIETSTDLAGPWRLNAGLVDIAGETVSPGVSRLLLTFRQDQSDTRFVRLRISLR